MKAVIRIGVVILVILLIGFYSGPSFQENDILENESFTTETGRDSQEDNIPAYTDSLTRPKSGISVYVGRSLEEFKQEWGEPDRMDPGKFGQTWMIYKSEDYYLQAAIRDQKISAIFAMGNGVDSSPYYSGQPVDEIYRFTMITTEIFVEDGEESYQFELSEQDLHSRLLVPYDDLYAQLLIDSTTNRLMGVYFMDKQTLISQRPYEKEPTEQEGISEPDQELPQNLEEVNRAREEQLFDMVNFIRKENGLSALERNEAASDAAREYSISMGQESTDEDVEEDTEEISSLEERLTNVKEPYESAAENTAYQFDIAPSVVHAWMNSMEHRNTMLDDKYTHTGLGVYGLYFTQNFLEIPPSDNETASQPEIERAD
ncbi:CAP domain-containing protein [Jeotgalibacillus aurantiacus]|uniref:CAP domain-containing protein n=1 Tax=Jeotgalibacillus aurantiacus TaxID=2763266 RepID=UPI001D0A0800|nr:CAP-associated domain-containing protein [Jeotgalibacillus aurantiacus]